MGDENNDSSAVDQVVLAIEESTNQLATTRVVEVLGRLVEQQKARLEDQRAGDRKLLLLAAGADQRPRRSGA